MDLFLQIIKFIIKPFTSNFLPFVTVWFLLSFVRVSYALLSVGDFSYAAYEAMAYYICSYVLVFLLSSLGRFGSVLIAIVYAMLALFNGICVYSILLLKSFEISSLITVITNTNINEVKDFFSTYFNLSDYLIVLFVIALITIWGFFIFRYRAKNMIFAKGGLICLFFFVIACGRNSAIWNDAIFKQTMYVQNIISPVVLSEHLSNPGLLVCEEGSPQKIVVIIGESFAKQKSSLYGYDKDTNPKLSALRNESLLFVYDNVLTPGINTSEAFKFILNSNRHDSRASMQWYEYPSIPEVFHLAGYCTSWVSNQAKNGVFDNISSSYSQVCDNEVFTGGGYDGGLLQHIPRIQGKELTFYHLMGQHPAYSARYPRSFGSFTPDMYQTHEKAQRSIIANYDNATLYNDSVVSAIMSAYSKEDAFVVYFSDHGMDIFDTDKSYNGHAKWGDSKSVRIGEQIPFMIYTSPIFKELHPNVVAKIADSVHNFFNTECLIFALMDIVGIKFSENEDVSKYTLFK